jgi:hypothetical protein
MATLLLFAFAAGGARGGVEDLKAAHDAVSCGLLGTDGYLTPQAVCEVAAQWGHPAHLQALQLGADGRPERAEHWQRIGHVASAIGEEGLVVTASGARYYRLSADPVRPSLRCS